MPRTRPAPSRTIRETRVAAGLSMSDVRDGMLAILPKHLVPSLGKLSRMETGATASLDTLVLFAMARVLGCGLRELSPSAADELETIKELVEHTSPCITAQGERLFALSAY